MHTLASLKEVTLVVTAALGCGFIFEWLKQPAILGYILAGVLLGPSFFAFIQDRTIVSILADFGVLLLLFLVGMELSLRSFKRVWAISLGVTGLQVAAGVLLAFSLSLLTGWSSSFSLLLGFLMALSSTAVSVKMLENTKELRTEAGKLTLGILVAQDLAIVPMILILRNFQEGPLWGPLFLKILISISLLTGLVWYLSRHQRVHIPFTRLFAQNPDLSPLVGLVFCFGFATLTGFLELSTAYGAFLAGLILGNSGERSLMLQTMTPIYSVLIMVFFLSIGLLLDFSFLWENLGKIFILLSLITLGKTLLNIMILHFFKRPWPQAFLTGVVLAQLGEFSFLLTSVGEEAGLLDNYKKQHIITLTALSLSFSPLWLLISRRLHESSLPSSSTLFQVMSNLFGIDVDKLKSKFTLKWFIDPLKKGFFYKNPSKEDD